MKKWVSRDGRGKRRSWTGVGPLEGRWVWEGGFGKGGLGKVGLGRVVWGKVVWGKRVWGRWFGKGVMG